MSYKTAVEKNFDGASETYNEVDYIQKQCAQHLLEMLTKHNIPQPKNILDIGCGTGNLTNLLYQHFPKSEFHLNDISAKMLAVAKSKYGRIANFRFYRNDIEQVEISTNYDLIASNLCFQWTEDFKNLLEKLYCKSRFMLFSLLLDGTFAEWRQSLEQHGVTGVLMKYPDLEQARELINSLVPRRFFIETQNFSVQFCNPFEAALYLKKLGANTTAITPANYDKVYQMLRNRDKACTLTYRLAFIFTERKI